VLGSPRPSAIALDEPREQSPLLFNSFHFALFFAVVYAGYLSLQGRLRVQNALLLAASYYFYGCWDVRFLGLLALTTVVDWFVALRIAACEAAAARRRWLLVSIGSNLSVLGFFKYFDFFTDNAVALLQALSLPASPVTLQILLPVGISFYTFQSIGYSVDVYRKQVQPVRRLTDFALFVAFFPQLVAGPIERAGQLLPQLLRPREISPARVDAGCFLVLWGLFQKLVLADNLAGIADPIFDAPERYSGADLWLGALAFTFQIYCDFAGYSDIARGVAKLLGFDLMLNFRLPYFARSPSEFWQRWHLSLSQWLRDYVYIPLGGNRGGEIRTLRNLMLTMLLGGLWHGAAWHFVAWGAYHGLLLVCFRWPRRARPLPRGLRVPFDVSRCVLMFVLTVIGWILFRASSLEAVLHFMTNIGLTTSEDTSARARELLLLCSPLLAMQVAQYACDDLLAPLRLPPVARGLFYALLVVAMLLFAVRSSMEFIYFRF
jgi:alginate O-acetyltransferase complex protein AlgI